MASLGGSYDGKTIQNTDLSEGQARLTTLTKEYKKGQQWRAVVGESAPTDLEKQNLRVYLETQTS